MTPSAIGWGTAELRTIRALQTTIKHHVRLIATASGVAAVILNLHRAIAPTIHHLA